MIFNDGRIFGSSINFENDLDRCLALELFSHPRYAIRLRMMAYFTAKLTPYKF